SGGAAARWSGLDSLPLGWPLGSGAAIYDLTLALHQGPRGLRGEIEYGTALFDRTTIERFAEQLVRLVAGALAAPDRPLAELDLLSPEQRHQLLVEWNDTGKAPGLLLPRVLAARAAADPGAPAVRCGLEALSRGELHRDALALAAELSRRGVGPGTTVAVAVERSARMVTALVAVLQAGGAYLPLDPGFPPERLAFMLEDAGPRVLLADAGSLTRLSGMGDALPPVLLLDGETLEPDLSDLGGLEPVPVTGDDLAYVLYTSGSTGRPKGVEVRHGALANLLWSFETRIDAGFGRRWVAVTTLSFDIAMLEIFLPLLAGGEVIVARSEEASDPARLAQLLEDTRADVLQATPATWRLLVASGWSGSRELTGMVGGEALPPELLAELEPRCGGLWNVYGPTETTIWSTAEALGPTSVAPGRVAIGRPLDNTWAVILDAQLRPSPPGVIGDLYLGGDGLARGYRGRPDLTAHRFVPAPALAGRAAVPGERLYRTGDRARWLADGRLDFLGRSDQQVKIRGYRIELGEIESALEAHPSVVQAVAVVDGGGSVGERLLAYVVLREPDAGIVESELLEQVAARVPGYMVPAAVIPVAELPRTPNGKVDRRAVAALGLVEPTSARDSGEAPVAPRNALEEELLALFRDLLGRRNLGVDDDFFRLGGHSLLAVQLVARVHDRFGVDLPLASLFTAPTVAALARQLAGLDASNTPVLASASGDESAPLSFAQQRLWFLHRFDPASPAWGLPLGMRLRGRLEPRAFEAALSEIVRRHGVLRTVFPLAGAAPVQRVLPPAPVRVPTVDLSALAPPRREVEGQRLFGEILRRPFELARRPPWASLLLRLTPGGSDAAEHAFLLHQHHILTDGWSVGILLRELATLYNLLSSDGEGATSAEPTLQYTDFARWQRQRLADERVEHHLAYWRRQLDGIPVLEMPLDRPRPAVRSSAGAELPLELDAELVRRAEELARSRRTTLFSVLTATFAALLARWTGQWDLSLGTPVAGRPRASLEHLLGLFVDTLVLRADLSGRPSLGTLAGRLREVVVGAFEHQDLPFERLVDALQPERDPAHTPLFQAMISLQNAVAASGGAAAPLVGLESRPLGWSLGAGTAVHDLTLSLHQTSRGLHGDLEFATALFDRTTAQRLVEHFVRLLTAGLAEPDRPLEEIDLLSPGQRHQLLVEWNDTGEAPGALLPQVLATRAAEDPTAPAVRCGEETLSRGELHHGALALAAELARRGVRPGVTVAVAVERSAAMVTALAAVLHAGGAYVPLDPAFPAERLAFMLEDAAPALLLAEGSTLEHLAALGETLPPVLRLDQEIPAAAGFKPVPVRGDDLAYVLYTSGSTGRPKGVEICHGALANLLRSFEARVEAGLGRRLVAVTTLSFDIAMLELFLPLFAGGEVVVAGAEDAADPARLAQLVEDTRADLLQATPATWRLLVSAGWPGAPGLTGLVGGEALPPELLAELEPRCAALWNVYGPTETTIWSTAEPLEQESVVCGRVSIGRPLANTWAVVLDRSLRPVPPGVLGDLYLGGAGLARGYRGRPGLTAGRFVPAPALAGREAVAGERLYRTGDRARWLADGRLDFLGRSDQQVKVRGYRIELGEIESALEAHPAVAQAVAVVEGGGSVGERILAYVVLGDPGSAAVEAELLGQVAARVPGYMMPAAVMPLAELPRTPNGKVDRRALAALGLGEVAASDTEAASVPPRDRLEHELLATFEDLLGRQRIGVTDDFFRLGGHSLLAVRLVAAIERRFGRTVTLAELFRRATVEALAVELRRGRRGEAEGSLVPLAAGGSGAPLFLVHPVGGTVFCYAELVRSLGGDRPVHGLQAPGLEGLETPRERIEELAERYLAEVLAQQPEGPWMLGGWSMGGVVAWEMARRLAERGGAVAPVVLFDAVAEERGRPPSAAEIDLELLEALAREVGVPLAELGVEPTGWGSLTAAERLSVLASVARRSPSMPPDVDETRLAALTAVLRAHTAALQRYRPRGADLAVIHFRTAGRPPGGECDRRDLWRRLARRGVVEITAAGDHFSMLRGPRAVELARVLGPLLAAAEAAMEPSAAPRAEAEVPARTR
ncbi:MAG: amino acid adenylation domain-containing protein, partial [Acidobacteria bacterium]|nr:amino acid adenylation domain-containing protein [Acidobacteriota bacterium]